MNKTKADAGTRSVAPDGSDSRSMAPGDSESPAVAPGAAAEAFWTAHPKLRPRDSAHVDLIRIGGKDAKRALPLTRVDRDGKEHAIDFPEQEPELTAQVDWRQMMRAASLTRFESRVFLAHWKHLTPIYKLHHTLGCKPAEATRALQAVAQKLVAAGYAAHTAINVEPIQNSQRLVYRERMPSGVRPWTLSKLTEEFQEIMLAEKFNMLLISHADPSEFHKQRVIRAYINRRILVFTVEISEAEIQNEIATKMRGWREAGYSSEYVELAARDRLTALRTAEREAAERSRILALNDGDFNTQYDANERASAELHARLAEVEQKLRKLKSEFDAQYTGQTRDLARYVTSGAIELEKQRDTLRSEMHEVTWLRDEFREQRAYRAKVALQPELEKLQSKVESTISEAAKKLSASPVTTSLIDLTAMYSNIDPIERSLLLAATRSLVQLSQYRNTKEKVAA